MTKEELHELYDKVTTDIWNYESYHVRYSYGNEYWAEDGSYVSFDVYGHSDQGRGADWTEYWSIYSNGEIHTEEACYKNYEEFKAEWL